MSIAKNKISTHSPRVGRTLCENAARDRKRNFNSLAPRGANQRKGKDRICIRHFNSLAPIRSDSGLCHFNSLAPRGANPRLLCVYLFIGNFNSLAPRGANRLFTFLVHHIVTFQLTRPTRGEPCSGVSLGSSRLTFQLTRPARGEPRRWSCRAKLAMDFNSLAPRGAHPLGEEFFVV